MSKGVHLDLKTTAKSKSMRSAAARVTLFGEPQLLAGEDAAVYDEFLARIRAAVNPVDIIDEMFIADVASLEWEVLRWRRLKWTLMQATGLKALNQFLVEQLESNYALHQEHFKSYLVEIFQNNLPEGKWTLRRCWLTNVPSRLRTVTKNSMKSSAASA